MRTVGSSQRRKYVYGGGIAVLLALVGVLSFPATGAPGAEGANQGGLLSRIRAEKELGESTLGEVDPTSFTMNLVLVGLRGVAANVLWHQANQQQERHEWAKLGNTARSIILLQPHFINVWKYQGWNLSYNVSAEFDAVEDRYFWVKQGTRFLQEGVRRNQRVPDLYWEVGAFMGDKIGGSDERVAYRRLFLEDTEPEGSLPPFNPEKRDNYLVAKQWYNDGVSVSERYGRLPMGRSWLVFRKAPSFAQMQYAQAMEKDGVFDEKARYAWQTAHREWTEEFGQVPFTAWHGNELIQFKLNYTPEEFGKLPEHYRYWVKRYRHDIAYDDWEFRARVAMEPDMLAARRAVYEGTRAYLEGDLFRAEPLYEEGLRLWDRMIERFPKLMEDPEAFEEAVQVLQGYAAIVQQLDKDELVRGMQPGEHLPDDFPLKAVWEEHQLKQRQAIMAQQIRNRRGRGGGGGGGRGRGR